MESKEPLLGSKDQPKVPIPSDMIRLGFLEPCLVSLCLLVSLILGYPVSTTEC